MSAAPLGRRIFLLTRWTAWNFDVSRVLTARQDYWLPSTLDLQRRSGNGRNPTGEALVEQLVKDWGTTVLQVGVNRHFVHGVRKVGPFKFARTCLCDLSLIETAQILKSCDAFIGIDSGPLHLAAAVGIPVAGIFGPVDPRLRAPVHSLALVLEGILCPANSATPQVPQGGTGIRTAVMTAYAFKPCP